MEDISLKANRLRRAPLVLLGIGLAGGVTAVALLTAQALGGGESETAATAEPVTTAPSSPARSTPADMVVDAPRELLIHEYGDGESLVFALVEERNKWQMSGATQKTLDGEDPTLSRKDYAQKVAAPLDRAYISALYVDTWHVRADLSSFIGDYTQAHMANIFAYMGTSESSDPANMEPYMVSTRVISIKEISNDGKKIVAEFDYERSDNSDKNLAEKLLMETYSTPIHGDERVTWIQEDGAWKIAEEVGID